MRVVICNDGVDCGNKGDEAILDAMQADIRKHLPEANLYFFSYSKTRSLPALLRLLAAISRCKVFVLGGGHPFQDLTSRLFMYFGLCLLLYARLCGRKTFCYAVGAGPISARGTRWLARLVLNRCDRIAVRDEVSGRSLRMLGVAAPKLVRTADAAFALPAASSKSVQHLLAAAGVSGETPLIVVCLRRWFVFDGGFWPSSKNPTTARSSKSRQLDDALVRFFDSLLQEFRVELLFVPMRRADQPAVAGQDDDLYSKEICSRLVLAKRAFLLPNECGPQEIKGIITGAEFVISVRMHPLILAASAGVPMLGIPFTDSKGEGLFDLLGCPESYLYIDQLDAGRLLERFRMLWARRSVIRTQLIYRAPELCAQAQQNAVLLRDVCREVL